MQKKTQNRYLIINVKAAKTFEQNSRELTKAAQDATSRFNASVNNSSGSGSSNTGTSSSTTTTSTSAA